MQNKNHPFASLQFREFRTYLVVRFFYTLAYIIQSTILGFYVYQLTHSKLSLAFLGLSEVIPAVGLALYGGHVIDRSEKRKVMTVALLCVMLTSAVLCVSTYKGLHLSAGLILSVIYGMLFINGVARAFYEPAIFVIYSQSVPKEVYANANNWNGLGWQAAYTLGPPAGGIIYAIAERNKYMVSGITATLGIVILLCCISLCSVLRLKKMPAVCQQRDNSWKTVTAGLRFILRNRSLLYAMNLDLFSVLFGGVLALLPVYAIDILKVGADGLGTMRMAIALGASSVMLILMKYPPVQKPWRNLLLAAAGFGISIIAFGLSKSFTISLICLFSQGAFDSISVVIRGNLMQLLTPKDMLGRVSAVNSMFIGSSSEIGNFESGIAAHLIGTTPAVLVGGSMTLLVVAIVYVKGRNMVHFSLEQMAAEVAHNNSENRPGAGKTTD